MQDFSKNLAFVLMILIDGNILVKNLLAGRRRFILNANYKESDGCNNNHITLTSTVGYYIKKIFATGGSEIKLTSKKWITCPSPIDSASAKRSSQRAWGNAVKQNLVITCQHSLKFAAF